MKSTIFTEDVVPQAPDDPHYGLRAAFRADTSDQKVDLIIGVYRDDDGKPWNLPVVKKAEAAFQRDATRNHEYLPITGLPSFTLAAQKLILGTDSPAIKENRVCTVQTISGTGAVHLGGLFMARNLSHPPPKLYLPTPTWANHNGIFTNVGLTVDWYPYYSLETKLLDFDRMISTVRQAPPHSIILLHACAHNPTGIDPTEDQWKEIAQVIYETNLIPFFDCAYQGFASGSISKDNFAIRHFIELGIDMLIAQSFSKNLGLYGQRVGCLHIVVASGQEDGTATSDAIKRISSQVSALQRAEISNPPIYGAQLASIVLNTPALFEEWQLDLRTMADRILQMRQRLMRDLDALGTPGQWDRLVSQIGMFAYTSLTVAQVRELRGTWHVYLTEDGRISVAGLNTRNVTYCAQAIDDVVRRIG
ncbi:hypothetical protein LTR84_006273 [Exophiala bonariae]|uniref:Aspartate aminotransferase n=1 Tax=Exophiala bonariae TaxID=1690606 RepID=A0AAV9N603_9EURO|nr:hypothetical protein LTR84_006273 [Exophiala bonariae]